MGDNTLENDAHLTPSRPARASGGDPASGKGATDATVEAAGVRAAPEAATDTLPEERVDTSLEGVAPEDGMAATASKGDAVDVDATGASGVAAANAPGVAEGADPGPEQPQDLGEELEALRREAEKYREALLRKQAEFDNLRKRTRRDVEQAHKFALEGFVQALIPVLDSLDQGLAISQAGDAAASELHEGMVLIHKQMVAALGQFGIEVLEPVGEKFDPEQHQAMTSQADSDQPRGTVLSVFQKGYVLNGRLVRPAMVVVAD